MSSPLRLSPHVLPQFRQGIHALTPQNLSGGVDRAHYARSIVDNISHLLAVGRTAVARQLYEQFTFASYFAKWVELADGRAELNVLPELENALRFSADEVGVLLQDGRQRDDSAMIYVPSGDATPRLVELLAHTHRGIERDRLIGLADELALGIDDAFIAQLIERGVLEPAIAPPARRDDGSAIVWMGHAYVRAWADRGSVWFDPFPMPRMRWTADEQRELFGEEFPDHLLLADYGPHAHHVTQDEVAMPVAVFITHQDVDHFDLGALSLLAPEIPIYVPAYDRSKPWNVDLVGAARAVIGGDRVREIAHGETVAFGAMRVTAFPFTGEFPPSLPHAWNCYYVELPDQAWALCADAAITELQVEWLRDRRRGDHRPFGIMTNRISHERYQGGYRDNPMEPLTFNRLYSWYLPPARTFDRSPTCGLPSDLLAPLARDAGLGYVFPYAHGNLPWYRVKDSALHLSHIGSHSLAAFRAMEQTATKAGLGFPYLKHARPFTLAAG